MRARLYAGVAVVAALAFGGYGVVRGTWAAGGSDSSCFALMADAFAGWSLQPRAPLANEAPWSEASRTFAPAGFVPSPRAADAASPVCAPGYALLLAPWRWLGRDAIFLVTPISGALLVLIAFAIGRALSGAGAGAAASVLVATTPAALFQVTQPMNDIAVTAAWLAVIAASRVPEPSRSWLMGGLVGVATLIRPNLAPAAIAAGLWFVGTLRASAKGEGRRRLLGFAIAASPFALVLFVLNERLYGSPFSTGYGDPRSLFSLAHVAVNLRHYGTALIETQLGVPLLGVFALAVAGRREVVVLALAIAAAVTAVYLLYQPFPEWWYLRFLLPATVPLTILAATVGAWAIRKAVPSTPLATATGVAAVIVFVLHALSVSGTRHVFDLQRLEARFRRSGDVVRERLPANAILVTVWHSGTVRYHADRPSMLWDAIAPGDLEQAIEWLRGRGLEPYLLLEQWEEPLFRARFAGRVPFGDLDWPPRFDVLRQVRIYRVADREPFVRGASVPTEYVVR